MTASEFAGNRGQRPSWLSSARWIAAPALLFLFVFNALPSLLQLVLAFTDWSTYHSAIRFTGLKNFQDLLADGSLVSGIRTTLTFGLTIMVAQNLLGLGLALALERPTRVNNVFRTIFFLPVLISPIAIGFAFLGFLSSSGPLNGLLGALTGTTIDYEWLGDSRTAIFVVALINSWHWFGLNMLIYLAGLSTIPLDYYEAARVEGANTLQLRRHITLPLLAPAITVNVIFTLIGALNTFDIIYATTHGGPAKSTQVLNIFIYGQYGFGYFGYATAMSLVLFTLVCVLALPLLVVLRRREVSL